MTEKQASSEIAQSRERNMEAVEQSEKMWEKHFSHAEIELSKKGMFCYGYEAGFAAAERDTRERCAHEARRWILRFALRYENSNVVGFEIADALAEALRTNKWPESVWKNPFVLAERIRGKE